MSFPNFPKMIVSAHAGWDELDRIHPSVLKTLFLLVLPLSLVPAAMIVYAGTHYGSRHFSVVDDEVWTVCALVFLFAELAAVPLMARAIQRLAASRRIHAHFHEAFMVAAVAPVPMWLSALALWVPSPLFVVSVVVIGLATSVSLVYHGIAGLLHMHEEADVTAITYAVMGLGAAAWMALILLTLLPLLWA